MEKIENQFGSFDNLSSEIEKKINEIILFLDSTQVNYCIYYGYPIIDEDNHKEYVKGLIIAESKIVLLYEHEQEVDVYGSSLVNHISADKSLFKIVSNYNSYVSSINLQNIEYEKLGSLIKEKEVFTSEEIKKINRAIQVAFNLTSEDLRDTTSDNTLGAQLKTRNTYIGNYDSTQFNMVHSDITKHQRIRGLAGSGKTILMLKKLAFLHYNNKDLNLAFVFFTTSLKQSASKMFKDFYKDYDRYGTPDMKRVSIIHAWGGAQRKGFYSDLCDRTGSTYLNFENASRQSGNNDAFEYACSILLKQLKEKEFSGIYDFVFVDEAQDFGINFFKLCLSSLRKMDLSRNKTQTGFLVYAYDELQSLREENQIPSKQQIFGDELECQDVNLDRCYRTPVEILTSAHALGLGVYRKVDDSVEHPLVNLVDEQTLVDTGYEKISGNFVDGEEIVLRRTEPRSGIQVNDPVSFENEADQYKEVSKKILYLMDKEDIIPNDIMIIDLDTRYIKQDHERFTEIFNDEFEKYDGNKSNIRINLVDSNNPVRVKVNNAVSFTTIFRAKGNEANLVFILNCNKISLFNRNSSGRNQIFTAMTRAKWQVWLYGRDMEGYSYELDQVKRNDYKLKFIYPTEKQREAIKKLGDSEEKVVSKISDTEELLNELPLEVVEAMLRQRLDKGK